jgi:hypothetical protein|tara:strand:- start:447 stop:566 length:120 start_codon:yes stop_codon:yes gene_type:complete
MPDSLDYIGTQNEGQPTKNILSKQAQAFMNKMKNKEEIK